MGTNVGNCWYLFFFNQFIYFNWRLITLQYCGGFCHTSTLISHGRTCVPPSWTLLPPPSPLYPSRLSQSISFEPCFMHWSSILYMVTYMSQCYSLILSHPFLLPHSPKVCSSHLFYVHLPAGNNDQCFFLRAELTDLSSRIDTYPPWLIHLNWNTNWKYRWRLGGKRGREDIHAPAQGCVLSVGQEEGGQRGMLYNTLPSCIIIFYFY